MNLASLLTRAPSRLASTAVGLMPFDENSCFQSVYIVSFTNRTSWGEMPMPKTWIFVVHFVGGSSYKHHPADFHNFLIGSTTFEDALEQYFSNFNESANPLEIL